MKYGPFGLSSSPGCLWRFTPPGRGSTVASSHSQRVSFSGSVKNAKTVSGLAPMRSSLTMGSVPGASVTASPPFFRLRFVAQDLQPLVPERIQELAQARKSLGAGTVQAARAVPPLAEETRLLEHPEVLGDRRSGHVAEAGGDLPGRHLGVPHETEDLAPARLHYGPDDVLSCP